MKYFTYRFVVAFLFIHFISAAQNESAKWYFGMNAGIDFLTNPPSVLSNGALVTFEGCSTISDGSGNLLFYTDGSTVWNSSHVQMANGNGLFGNSSTTQAALIVRQPGSSILYHIFTLGANGNGSLYYSTVDMSLASGSGSVITKNVLLSNLMTEKLTGTQHCNGIDYWIISHEGSTNNFKSFLVTTAGVSVTPVISATGPTNIGGLGTMKTSPNGRMLASSRNNPSLGTTVTSDVFDFDKTSGQVTFQYSLCTGYASYGCEFSPDGTKLYIAGYAGSSYNLAQFDICAGSASAVAASMYTMSCTSIIGAMQVAPNGKIYCARPQQQILGVINSPNASGSLCNFVELGFAIGTKTCQLGLPNFANPYRPPVAPFTYSISNCQTISFSAPNSIQTTTQIGCVSSGYSVTGLLWNFGDPSSGIANTSTTLNPQHVYNTAGSYTTNLIIYYSCGRSNDTLSQVINLTATPVINVSGVFNVCKGDKRTYTANGANTYSWSNSSSSSNTVSLTHTATTVYTVTGTSTTSTCMGKKTFTVTVQPCTEISEIKNTTQLNIYPNPASNRLFIESNETVRILLLNHHGSLILDQSIPSGQKSLDLSTFEEGVYFLKVISKEGVINRRIVKCTKE